MTMRVELKCDYCGKTIYKYSTRVRKHSFCSRQCLSDFSNKSKNPDGYASLKDYTNISKHMSELNQELNPTRMTDDVKEKLREAHLNSGEGKTYTKLHSRHEHRIVAEQLLGRPLKKGEVVHHIDGDKRNNSPDNLMVFSSQAEHAAYHAKLRKGVVE